MTQNSAYPNVEFNQSCDPPDPISSTLYEDIDSNPQKLDNILQQPQVGEKKHQLQYEQPDYSNVFPSELYQTVECGQQNTLATDSLSFKSQAYDDIIGVSSHPQPPMVEDYNVLQHKPQTLRRVEEEEYQVLGEWESHHNI